MDKLILVDFALIKDDFFPCLVKWAGSSHHLTENVLACFSRVVCAKDCVAANKIYWHLICQTIIFVFQINSINTSIPNLPCV